MKHKQKKIKKNKYLSSSVIGIVLFVSIILGLAIVQTSMQKARDNQGRASEGIKKLLLFSDSFENEKYIENWKSQTGNDTGIQITKAVPARDGNFALQISVDKSWPEINNGPRSEIYRPKSLPLIQSGSETWYAFSVFFDKNYVDDPAQEIISQFHTTNEEGVPFLIQSINGDLIIKGKGFEDVQLPKTKGDWMDVIVHNKWSDDANASTGLTQVYINGKQVVNSSGANLRPGTAVYFKLGLYKSGWKGTGSTTTFRRLYFDRVMIGGASNTVEDFK